MMVARKSDQTGRSGEVLRFGKAKRWSFEGQFIGHPRDLRESAGFRALSAPARRVLDFLELEHMQHAGAENGNLLAPYNQLVDFGVSRRDICPSLDMLEAFGVIRRTSHGERLGGRPKATTYALTFYPVGPNMPTEDWKAVTQLNVDRFKKEKKDFLGFKQTRTRERKA